MGSDQPKRYRGSSLWKIFSILLMIPIALLPKELSKETAKRRPPSFAHTVAIREGATAPLESTPPRPFEIDPRESRFHPLIHAASLRHRVDSALVKAVIRAESEYDPWAMSAKGAVGLMQLMPGTARELGVSDRFDPELNVDGGVRHLKSLIDLFDGNLEFVLAAYHSGISSVKKYSGIPPFKSTRRYVKKVLGYYRNYRLFSVKEKKAGGSHPPRDRERPPEPGLKNG